MINKDNAKLKGSKASLTNLLHMTKFGQNSKVESNKAKKGMSSRSPKGKTFNQSSSKILKVMDFSISQITSAFNSR